MVNNLAKAGSKMKKARKRTSENYRQAKNESERYKDLNSGDEGNNGSAEVKLANSNILDTCLCNALELRI